MVIKGDQTRQMILSKAKTLLIEKGYNALTMSDICASTGLSRGGLYRYFSSTEEVLLTLLSDDKDHWLERLDNAIKNAIPAQEILCFYLKEMMRGILAKEGRLSLTVYEYVRSTNSFFGLERYKTASSMLENLFVYGQKRGEFSKFDVQPMVRFFLTYIDGLRISSTVIFPTEGDTDRQMNILKSLILTEKGKGDER